MKNIHILVFTLITNLFLLNAQQQGGDFNNISGFENSGIGWSMQTSTNWNIATAKAATGSNSLKFTNTQAYVSNGIYSIETGYTIQKIRTANVGTNSIIIASTYEGNLMGIGFDGAILWKTPLSGFMNHDFWCDDLDGDGKDETVIANADGNIYCLNSDGKLLWKKKFNDAPMYSVCIVHKDGVAYVVCGGFDNSIYYLTATGTFVKEIKSSTYSQEKAWGTGTIPPNYISYANFIRPMKKKDGTEILIVNGSNNHMQVPGSIYQFYILENLPFRKDKAPIKEQIGDLRIMDPDGDGNPEIILGTSAHYSTQALRKINPNTGLAIDTVDYTNLAKGLKLDFGYRVTQTEYYQDGSTYKYFCLTGNFLHLFPSNFGTPELLLSKYSFNDLWRDPLSNKLILASSQSGGSCIHIIDTQNSGWKNAFVNLTPPGKIQTILDNTTAMWTNLNSFVKPTWERAALPVYFMSDNPDKLTGTAKTVCDNIRASNKTPFFLGGSSYSFAEDPATWSRDTMSNVIYRNKRDSRRSYTKTQAELLAMITPWYTGFTGISMWGGHGNDPYFFSNETRKKIFDIAPTKKTVLIFPELQDETSDFAYALNNLFYPTAQYASTRNGQLFIRCKDIFWLGSIYLPMWSRLISGEFANVFIPSKEETTSKSMELSLAARMGIWASGSVDSWGARCVPDNPSFDRSRQFSDQTLPTNFLRTMVYSIASGAQYLDNFAVDQDYMSILWELTAKGALYVPKREEIVSFSPVHLSMKEPDHYYLNEGTNTKWNTFFNATTENANKLVFSHLNGTWLAAPVTDWDFSRYAAGVKDRRQNFIPPYPNGMVMITPPQTGVFAATNVTRGKLTDHLHPLYKTIMKEYYTDGRNYYSADGTQTFKAEQYYNTIEADIKASAKKIPLTVTGDNVAWVVAQTSPTHLRLTLVDGGYINPDNRKAIVTFHTVSPKKMTDLLDSKTFDVTNPASVIVDIPCGMFRFIDIELQSAL